MGYEGSDDFGGGSGGLWGGQVIMGGSGGLWGGVRRLWRRFQLHQVLSCVYGRKLGGGGKTWGGRGGGGGPHCAPPPTLQPISPPLSPPPPGVFSFGLLATAIFANAGQVVTGTPAPHFLAVCRPNYTALGCSPPRPAAPPHFVPPGGATCAGDPPLVAAARRAFPCKEAALGAYGGAYAAVRGGRGGGGELGGLGGGE